MLLDEQELSIMSTAFQVTLQQSSLHTDTYYRQIFDNFFGERAFSGLKVLELGPGQYDFARLIAAAGAHITAIDVDPAVVELGRKRGYTAIRADFREFDWRAMTAQFDGLFCCRAIAPFLLGDPKRLNAFIDDVVGVLEPNGWGFIAPWHNTEGQDPEFIRRMLDAEHSAFERNGFRAFDLGRLRTSRFEYDVVFLRNVDPGDSVEASPSLWAAG